MYYMPHGGTMRDEIVIYPGVTFADLARSMVKLLRNSVRDHRKAVGDDRCWLDDYLLWSVLPDTPNLAKPTSEAGMLRCKEFYLNRRADEPDPIPSEAILDPAHWDDDLERPDVNPEQAFASLIEAIRAHRDLPEGTTRTLEHDRILYLALPERMPADFRLPPKDEFLGRSANPRVSCPNFWASHASCPAGGCYLHAWGPCGSGNQHWTCPVFFIANL